jgi:hypothetical protein
LVRNVTVTSELHGVALAGKQAQELLFGFPAVPDSNEIDYVRLLPGLNWQVQNSLQSRIGRYYLSRKAALGQTDRGLLEKGIEFGLGRLPRPGDFADCTHGFTLLGVKVGRKRELGCFRPWFSQNGTENSDLCSSPNPTIDRRSCASEGQMSPKTKIILWKTRGDLSG